MCGKEFSRTNVSFGASQGGLGDPVFRIDIAVA
jgi:hypothetical protein